MIIKYTFIGDRFVVSIPDNMPWEIFSRYLDRGCYEDCGLYLLFNGEERSLSDADSLCAGRTLPESEIGRMHEEVVESIAERLAADPGMPVLDIDKIVSEVMTTKFEQYWAKRGYIKMDENGNW